MRLIVAAGSQWRSGELALALAWRGQAGLSRPSAPFSPSPLACACVFACLFAQRCLMIIMMIQVIMMRARAWCRRAKNSRRRRKARSSYCHGPPNPGASPGNLAGTSRYLFC